MLTDFQHPSPTDLAENF